MMTVETGRFPAKLVPRSPRRAFPAQIRYWTTRGLSSPYNSPMASQFSFVIPLENWNIAVYLGSPLARDTPNTKMLTANSVTAMNARRLSKNVTIP